MWKFFPEFKEEACYKYYQVGWILDKDRTPQMWDRKRWKRQRDEYSRAVVSVKGKILFFSDRYEQKAIFQMWQEVGSIFRERNKFVNRACRET